MFTFGQIRNKYVRPRYTRMEIYVYGRVACCPLVSHIEYAPRARRERQTDGRQTVTLRVPLDAASVTRNLAIVNRSLVSGIRSIDR